MLNKSYGNDTSSKEVLPVSMAENEIEGTSFYGFISGVSKCDEAIEELLKRIRGTSYKVSVGLLPHRSSSFILEVYPFPKSGFRSFLLDREPAFHSNMGGLLRHFDSSGTSIEMGKDISEKTLSYNVGGKYGYRSDSSVVVGMKINRETHRQVLNFLPGCWNCEKLESTGK
ncbi:hypothetical protein TNCV_640301 [Trichonephila clavipes]|nr:hypothetical protein TNCV_640301 [Trichonephila clavipes]